MLGWLDTMLTVKPLEAMKQGMTSYESRVTGLTTVTIVGELKENYFLILRQLLKAFMTSG